MLAENQPLPPGTPIIAIKQFNSLSADALTPLFTRTSEVINVAMLDIKVH